MNSRSQPGTPQAGYDLHDAESLEQRDQQPHRVEPVWSRLRHWMHVQTMAPSWLPTPLRHPVVSYLAAVGSQVIAVALTFLLEYTLPGFGHRSILVLLGVVLVALTWGGGPSLVATLVGAFLLDFFDFPLLLSGRSQRRMIWSVLGWS